MSDEQNNQPGDSVDRATEALRDITAPSDPSPQLLAATLARMQAARAQQTRSSRWRIASVKTLSRIAASILMMGMLAGVVLYLGSSWGSSMAFADVLKQVREVRSAQFKTTATISTPGQPARIMVSETIVAEPARMRSTVQVGPGTEVTFIIDLEANKMLQLYPEQKRAELMEMSNFPAGRVPPNLLDELRKLREGDGTPVGDKVIGGQRTRGFKVVKDGREMTLWIDTDTKLPVQIDMQRQTGTLPPTSTTMTDFKWGQTVDESLFSLTPPAGYEVTNRQMDMSTLKETGKEKVLIDALKSVAELNGGVYPDGFDQASLMKVLTKSREPLLTGKAFAPNSPEWKELQARQMQATVAFIQGSAFTADPRYGSDWHYAGMNVQAGKAGVPIFWYRPTGSDTYRVIDADLKVHSTAPSDLPAVPSVMVGGPAAVPATQPRR